jgi:Tol biopolymer transport system component
MQRRAGIDLGSLHGEILFTRAGNQYQDETVFTAHADGSHHHRITGFGKTCCARWSRDGKRILIAAAEGQRITTGIIRPDGSGELVIRLPAGTLQLGPGAWSANGTRIAFEGWEDTNARRDGIYYGRLSAGGHLTDLVQLTHARNGMHDLPMDVSANGSRVFFFRPVKGFPVYGQSPEGSLFVVGANGKGLKRVTPAGMPVEVVGNGGGKLSQSGKWIVFTSAGKIWKIHSNGSGLTKVFSDRSGRLAITPTWSPDGAYIMFGLDPAGELGLVDTPPINGLYVIRADGSGLTPVIRSADFKREPDWVAK